MKLICVGVDLAKNVFQLHGVDRFEKTVWRRKLVRSDWITARLDRIEPDCEIGMEACIGAHHWATMLQAQGYTVKLIALQFVKPYAKSNKNDVNDAEAICEAMSRPSIRFVAIKTVEQQNVQAVHQVRSVLIDQRESKANQLCDLASKYGLVASKKLLHLLNEQMSQKHEAILDTQVADWTEELRHVESQIAAAKGVNCTVVLSADDGEDYADFRPRTDFGKCVACQSV